MWTQKTEESMKARTWLILLAMVAMALCASAVFAQDSKKEAPQGMPEMGPPKELKEIEFLVGTWDCEMKMHMSMDPNDTTWMTSKGTAAYKWSVGGAVLESSFEQSMMGQQFIGGGWEAYDREKKEWQMVWTDNMAARMALYTGTKSKDGSVFTGEDLMMGKPVLTRISTFNETADAFDWKGESSMDNGKTWMVWGTAKYTKRK